MGYADHGFGRLCGAVILAATLTACGSGPEDILREADLPEGPRVTFEVREPDGDNAARTDVLFIPGLSSPASVFAETADALGGAYRIHLTQLAGYAGMPPVRTRDGVLKDAQAEIATYLETCCPDGAILVGHSLGGNIGIGITHARPGLVSHLVIVDARPSAGGSSNAMALRARASGQRRGVLDASDAEYEARNRQLVSDVFASTPEHVDLVVGWSMNSHRPTVAQTLYELTLTDQRPLLPEIQTPTTILATWHPDRRFTFEESTTYWNGLYEALPNGEVRLVRDSRHFIMLDQPAAFVAELQRVIGLVEAAGP